MASAPNRSPILPYVDHALPYQVMFEEYRARRPRDLLFATLEAFPEFRPADLKDTDWNDLVNQRNVAISKLNDARRRLDVKLGKTGSNVQDPNDSDEVDELLKEIAKLERRIWLTFNTPLKAPRWGVMGTKFQLETLWRELTALRILRADLNSREFSKELKIIDLTTLFKHLDRRSAHLDNQLACLRSELRKKQQEYSQVEEGLWQPLTTQANRVTAAYAKLKERKTEPSKVHLPVGSLEELEFRGHQRRKEIMNLEQQCKTLEAALLRILHKMNCTAVCLSGGGIRSASFSLGVLQGLSRFSMGRLSNPAASRSCADPKSQRDSLMRKLDYISTVSGGGYIGCWLMAWARRVGYRNVVAQLSIPAPTSGDPEQRTIRHLREYTSYLAPKYGFTLDSITLAAIVMRNMFLNWLMLVPAVVALLCLPHMVLSWSYSATEWGKRKEIVPVYFWVAMGIACVLIGVAAWFAAKHMAFPRELNMGYTSMARPIGEPRSVKLFVVLVFVSAWVLGEIWLLSQVLSQAANQDSPEPRGYLAVLWILSSIPPFVISWYRARNAWSGANPLFERPNVSKAEPRFRRLKKMRLVGSYVAPLVTGFVAMLLLWGAGELFAHRLFKSGEISCDTVKNLSILTIVPTVMFVLTIASAILSGLLSNIEREEEREWWSRAGGLLMALVFGWLGLCAIAYFGYEVLRGGMTAALAAVGLSTGYLGSLGGLSAVTASGLKRVKREQLNKVQRFLADHNLITPAVCSIAVLCLAVLLGALTSWLRIQVMHLADYHPEYFGSRSVAMFVVEHPTLVVFVVASAIAILANRFINVNVFSLHGMYRMRLTRAYLGASNLSRQPNPFTNFDPTDNLYEANLPQDGRAPLHVINAALNLVATRNLAWQQRKAEPFCFTPLHCGCWRIGYARTPQYGGYRGVRVGTAMAVSGAAVSPNMGYHSSALVTFLMAFFNTRLGWWLPNPGWPDIRQRALEEVIASAAGTSTPIEPNKLAEACDFLQQAGPTWGLAPLIAEAFGHTDDASRFIQLSDGGHFENLGLYEMVLRRCHSIIIVDGDADTDYDFEDLGNAVRKIYIDLGIIIRFPDFPSGLPMKQGKDKEIDSTSLYCFTGEIDYGCIDEDAPKGNLIVIKPVLNGSEPEDIRSYASAHETFPHESTVNQFFNEAQFESYRHLGSWVVDTITREHTDPKKTSMQSFLEFARNYSTSSEAVSSIESPLKKQFDNLALLTIEAGEAVKRVVEDDEIDGRAFRP